MFKFKSKLVIAVMVMLGITAFVSCEKEDVLSNKQSTSMKTFSSMDEYFTELNKVNKMSTHDLINYEKANGYYSMRRKCEEVYLRANPENFDSKDELIAFVESNSEHHLKLNFHITLIGILLEKMGYSEYQIHYVKLLEILLVIQIIIILIRLK